MICSAAIVDRSSSSLKEGEGSSRYLDPHSQQTFVFDHLRLSASELAPYVPPDAQMEDTRAELQALAEAYIKNHFQNAVSTVFSLPSSDAPDSSQLDQVGQDALAPPAAHPPLLAPSESVPQLDSAAQPASSTTDLPPDQSDPQISPASSSSSSSNKFKLFIVGNKYNPTNYWTGRWRSIYEIDMESGKIEGSISVNVHYYEQGNVQLSTKHLPKIEVPSPTNNTSPREIIKAIQTAESQYQAGLNSAYSDLGEHTFKLLRRALPVTKQKINWNNIKSRIVLDDH
ncbi:F-actin-capping protein subunit alpha [Puccinia graminis f. sp. tritici]|nr:F-actin-capping protein subunit alpha [Puccinia graminis f. sp. tritici]KAA1108035.1 F-actin-capping protein subunit alpha, variant 2 [Puccinia graminis f. sp. tritici]